MERFKVCGFSTEIDKNRNRNPDKNNNNIVQSTVDSSSTNVIMNHDFSSGMNSWHPNCCNAFIVTAESGLSHGVLKTSRSSSYAVVTNRKETWQGLEQDITSRVKPCCLYKVSATVSVSGPVTGLVEVKATLKLKNQQLPTHYQFIAKTCVFKEKWLTLEGMFLLPNLPKRVVFYLEGPSPGIDLLIQSVTIQGESESAVCSNHQEVHAATEDDNIIVNPSFEDGLRNWFGRSCKVVLKESMADGKIVPESGKFLASATERTANWTGIRQEMTGRVQRKQVYEVTAVVRIYGNYLSSANIRATLWVHNPNQRDQYIGISNVQASDKEWKKLKGKFLVNGSPSRIVIYLEGPPPGTDILVNSLTVKPAETAPPSPIPPVVVEDKA